MAPIKRPPVKRQYSAKVSNVAGTIPEDTRVQGFRDSSGMLKNYKDLKVWQKSYALCLEIYRITAKSPHEERYVSNTRTSLTPGIPDSFSPTKLEKNTMH
jgi:hypothetical protein